jgi:hypothetical protein
MILVYSKHAPSFRKKKIRNFQYLRFLWEEHDNIVLETCLIHIIE